jgi:homoserine kinase
MTIRVPATSANLGPGFDVMGLALSLYCDVGVVGADALVDGAQETDDHHAAQIAFVRAGGQGRVWVRNAIPLARGMGFSGAAHIGGIVAAEVQRVGTAWSHETSDALAIGTELEGHADNVAPSLHGGIVLTSEGIVVQVPIALDTAFVMWVPEFSTSTNESRGKIGPSISLTDAVFNISRTAMFVTALSTGNVALLREATRDRIHQDIRFAASPACRDALDAGLAAGAWCGWLSGSGPTVALMCDPKEAASVAEQLPPGGHAKILTLDMAGATIL